jgi:hypothetical protein
MLVAGDAGPAVQMSSVLTRSSLHPLTTVTTALSTEAGLTDPYHHHHPPPKIHVYTTNHSQTSTDTNSFIPDTLHLDLIQTCTII